MQPMTVLLIEDLEDVLQVLVDTAARCPTSLGQLSKWPPGSTSPEYIED